ncbi:hypothetical protein [Sphingopyxis sp. QXT-31]|uniref:hypothetical protein n=1 Tax=Sphingopyxis sp. QXT-31 TaxID=1357916 RepID=UPI0012EB6CD5|nr:hypothetical protein [Sphingopyxis sp. QXT-31]
MPQPDIVALLQDIARDVHDAAFDFMEPARDRRDAEGRIARIEDLAARLRSTVRGHG